MPKQTLVGGRQAVNFRLRLYNPKTNIWAPAYVQLGGHIKSTAEAAKPTTASLMHYGGDLDGFAVNEVRATQTSVEFSSVRVIELNDPTAYTAALAMNGLYEVKSVASGAQVGLERLAGAAGDYVELPMDHRGISALVVTRKNGSTATAWQATTAYTLGAYKIPATANGHFYKVTVAGTSDSEAPTWPTTGGTVTDGTVTWQDMGTIIAAEGNDYTINSVIFGELKMADETRFEYGETLLLSYGYAANDFSQLAPNTRSDAYADIIWHSTNTMRIKQRKTTRSPFVHVVGTAVPELSTQNDMTWSLTLTMNPPDPLTHPDLPTDWPAGKHTWEYGWEV